MERRCCISFRVYYAFLSIASSINDVSSERASRPSGRARAAWPARKSCERPRMIKKAPVSADEECNKRSVPGPRLFIYIIYLFIVKWSRYCGRVCPREREPRVRTRSIITPTDDDDDDDVHFGWFEKKRARREAEKSPAFWLESARAVRLFKENEIKGRCNNARSFDREVWGLRTSFQRSTIYY